MFAVITPWRYLAASGPETERRAREERGARPEETGAEGGVVVRGRREGRDRGGFWCWDWRQPLQMKGRGCWKRRAEAAGLDSLVIVGCIVSG